MSPNQVFEDLLDSVKCSNLNFYIQQTPFTAIISVKKPLIRDKFGNYLVFSPTKIFRGLQTCHTCEECENGSLYHNHTEIVEYPNPGPSRGTYDGSPVTSCPNQPNVSITLLKIEQKRKLVRRGISCKVC